MGGVYYNEIESFCCDRLRERIGAGDLDEGFVDERDVQTVQAEELLRYRQWHLFAGIGGMPYGLRRAGVPADFPILTGGFPCQDISLAGRGAGLEGERSGLYWQLYRIARAIRPRWMVLENVPALRNRGADAVLLSLAQIGYAAWPLVVGADDVGAPHRRKRVWVVAYRDGGREQQPEGTEREERGRSANRGSEPLADASSQRSSAETPGGLRQQRRTTATTRRQTLLPPQRENASEQFGDGDQGLADAECRGLPISCEPGNLEEVSGSSSGERRAQASVLERCGEMAGDGALGVGLANSQGARLESAGGSFGVGAPLSWPTGGDTDGWPARPGEIQFEWEYSRTSLPASLLSIWNRVRAHYPETLRTAEARRQAEKAFDLPLGALDGAIDGLPAKLVRSHQVASLAALGNAVVPVVVEVIGRAILAVDEQLRAGK